MTVAVYICLIYVSFLPIYSLVLLLVSVMADVFRLFVPRDEDCIRFLEELRWASGVECPYCKSRRVKKNGTTTRNGVSLQRYKCNDCGRTFTVLTGTIFEGRKLSLGEMFYIIKNFPKWSINEIAAQLGLDYDDVHSFIMDVMSVADGEISLEKLAVTIEIDEVYVNSGEKGKKGD